ncbi:head-tail adaptor protein [Roseovarius sp.]|uniref:head-tail adaptor protein n=1 Tax=Roseovarius sp. TaxID=1486281 RepID=UPI003A9747EC
MARPRLNRKLVLEAAVRLPDGAGGVTQRWDVRGTIWGHVSARTGREAEAVGVSVARAGYRITVRSAPQGAASRPEAGQRLRDGARIFAILSVTEADADGRYLSLWSQEEVVQ